jgi:hypothetical protein
MRPRWLRIGKAHAFRAETIHHPLRVRNRKDSPTPAVKFCTGNGVGLTESVGMTAVRAGDLKSHGTRRVGGVICLAGQSSPGKVDAVHVRGSACGA